MEDNFTLDLEMVIGLTALDHEANVGAAFEKVSTYLTFKVFDAGCTYLHPMLSKAHLKKIFTLLKHTGTSYESIVNPTKNMIKEACEVVDNDEDVVEPTKRQ